MSARLLHKGTSVTVTAYNKATKRWSVTPADASGECSMLSGRDLALQVEEPCRPRHAVLHSLKRRASLNGQRVLIVSYQARIKRFAIKLVRDGMGLFALPANLREEDGTCLSEPVETRRTSSEMASLHALWAFEPGAVILEEAPTIMNE